MTDYLKTIAGVLIAIILYLILHKQGKEQAVLLSIATCCLIVTVAMGYLSPILSFFKKLQQAGSIDETLFQALLKAVCAGLIGEIVMLLCSDAGNSALGKSVQILTVGVMIWIALPILYELLSLIETILGGL